MRNQTNFYLKKELLRSIFASCQIDNKIIMGVEDGNDGSDVVADSGTNASNSRFVTVGGFLFFEDFNVRGIVVERLEEANGIISAGNHFSPKEDALKVAEILGLDGVTMQRIKDATDADLMRAFSICAKTSPDLRICSFLHFLNRISNPHVMIRRQVPHPYLYGPRGTEWHAPSGDLFRRVNEKR